MKIKINEKRIEEFFASPFNHGFIVVTNSKGYCSPALVFWNGQKLAMVGNRYGKSDTGTGALPSNLIATDADEFNAYALSQALVHIHDVRKANGELQDVYKVLLNLFHKLKNATVNSVESLASVVELVTYNKWQYRSLDSLTKEALAIVSAVGNPAVESLIRGMGHGALMTGIIARTFNIEAIRGDSDGQQEKMATVLVEISRELGFNSPREMFR